jgi:uncharacterized circularly permuted ATP-grasp superfamily protein/uncharacterized alpha-E superfamily protein
MLLSLLKNKIAEKPSPDGWYDETILSGELKPEWTALLENLNKLGPAELAHRNVELQKLLRENGVTYNVYEGHLTTPRTWNLDPIPWVLNNADWLSVEKGLKQRAELLNLILKDIYGPKVLLKKGLIPHELVFCHRGFLRQCDHVPFNTDYPLAVYAADIARGPDGRMWVINDRTQAPSGMGYALENRSAMIRVLPEMFKTQNVKKISDFFYTYYNSLCQLAPQNKENPRIALLTPGEKNETYFEHAFLADYLGINLVQGDDLIVRDSCLWIKTIHGLEQVDILLRRVDDIFCDPLEFRPDSRLGVPGLLEAVRKGNLVIANPLGSGILENPGLMPFLNNIAKYYFGEGLILPTVATWWCGQAKEYNYVMANLDNLLIKKIDRVTGSLTIVTSQLSKYDRERLREAIKATPYLYVGQEKVSFSAVPSLVNNELESRFAVLRGYTVAGQDGYSVMPGGLTRSSPEKGVFIVSNQAGGISKDTWILSEEKEANLLQAKNVTVPLRIRTKESLTSRMAENLFWAGRYSERLLASVRILRASLGHILENPNSESYLPVKERLLTALTEVTLSYPGFVGDAAKKRIIEPQNEIFKFAQDENMMGSMAFNLKSLVYSMQSVGGTLSNDTRRMVENLKENMANIKRLKPSGYLNLSNSVDKLYNSHVSLLGFITESMPREQGWLMLQAGRKIERSMLIASLIRSTLTFKDSDQVQHQILEAVLKSNQLISTYRYKYRTYLNLEYALQLLLFDENNPRSIAYQLQKLDIYLHNLNEGEQGDLIGKDEKAVLEANTKLRIADIEDLLKIEEGKHRRENLDKLLSEVTDHMIACSAAINQKYFSHTSEVKNLVITTSDLEP